MPTVSTFDTTKTDLLDLLNDARSGDAQLPDFQRGWVWDDEHIRDLIASVSRSFPIGTVMMLESGGEVNFRTRPLEGASPDSATPELLVLDGQQRLTSLFQSLMSGSPVATKDAKGLSIERWYYLDIQKCLDPNAEREEAVLSIPADHMVRSNFGRDIDLDVTTRSHEYNSCLFPLSEVFDHYAWAAGFREHHKYDPALSRMWDEFERDVVQRFRSYQLPVIRLHKQTPKEAVCLVFEKVNTGGVSLTVFELLTAAFAAVAPPEFELRGDWEGRQRRLHQHRVLRDVANTDFLQAITLLVTWERRQAALAAGEAEERLPAISCKRRDILRLTFDDYRRLADLVTRGFERVARFLHRERIFETKFLPYSTQVVPLAALLTVLDDDGIEKPTIRDKLARWYWCGVFGELYGSATETRFARDLPDVMRWIEDQGAVPRTILDANLTPERLVTLRTRNSAAYKGMYILLIREGARDFRTGEMANDQNYFEEAVDIHHIFPQKWCRERQPEPIPAGLFDSIVNKTPLTARTNRIIGGRAPSEYLRSLRENHGVSESDETKNLESHFIEPVRLRADDFEAFFDARRRELLTRIGGVMGKQLLVDPTEPTPEPVSYEEVDDIDQ
jgi:hypothetical protein